jgi:DNA-directed RNA polymerase subunit alpha
MEFDESVTNETFGRLIVEPFERGMGTTIGNALRRVLLSSLEGAAITSVKIEGVSHEFSTIPNVMEDIINICLNLKGVVVHLDADRPKMMTLDVAGEGEIKAKDILADPDIHIFNPEHHIATLVGDGHLKMDMEVTKGWGYISALKETPEDEVIGRIYMDANYSPIRHVKYEVHDTRVGQRTDYDKLILELLTDGSITPRSAISQAAEILTEYVSIFIDFNSQPERETEALDEEKERVKELLARNVNELELSVRSANCLKVAKIQVIAELVQKTEAEMLKYRNFGRKSLNEIKEVLHEMGLTLGMRVDQEEGIIIQEEK